MNNIIEFFSWQNTTNHIIIGLSFLVSIIAFASSKSITYKHKTYAIALCLALLLIWRFGWLPVGFGSHGDRERYVYTFHNLQNNGFLWEEFYGEQLWYWIAYTIGTFGNYYDYLIIISLLYVSFYYIVCVRLVNKSVFWLLIVLIASFGFHSYAINTMRAGIAASLMCLSFTFYNKKLWMFALMFAATLFHGSMMLPAVMLAICRYFDKTKIYMYLWSLSIPVSFIAGYYFNEIFASMIDDHRSAYMTTKVNEGYNIGFRIDFIIYSLLPMLVGSYYIYKKNYKDKFYKFLFNGYLLTNIFWILVIRSNFSDRFAYLSWFMIPFLLAYPILKEPHLVRRPNLWIGTILLGEAAFMLII